MPASSNWTRGRVTPFSSIIPYPIPFGPPRPYFHLAADDHGHSSQSASRLLWTIPSVTPEALPPVPDFLSAEPGAVVLEGRGLPAPQTLAPRAAKKTGEHPYGRWLARSEDPLAKIPLAKIHSGRESATAGSDHYRQAATAQLP
jgi:hypothetical protein